MPEGSYNLPASACQTGQILARVPGTPCHGCYALKGRYRFPNVKNALARRLASLTHPHWVPAMVALIQGIKHFRWHDSGDIQSAWHLQQIFKVCEATPDTQHWLPTQERQYLPDPEEVPANLVIRLSRSKIDGPVSAAWSHDSGVTVGEARTCPAPDQGGKCLDCRACWNKDIKSVIYGKH